MMLMRLRRLYRRLSYLTGSLRDLRSGMYGWMPLASGASLNQAASYPRPLCFRQIVDQRCCAGVVADLPRGHEKAHRPPVRIADGVQPSTGSAEPWCPYRLWRDRSAALGPLSTSRLDAVRCAFR
jgi:hypothetical protein